MKKIDARNYRGHAVAAFLLLAAMAILLPMNAAGKGWKITDPSWAHANGDRFVLNFGDSYVYGDHGNGTALHLKRALKQQYPELDVSDFRLRKVVLVAKTRRGGGSVQLKVGPESSDILWISAHPRNFDRGGYKSFERVSINSPFHDSWGPWQLLLRGTFKVREVVVFVERRPDRHHGKPHHGKHDRGKYYHGKHHQDKYLHDEYRMHHREPARMQEGISFRIRW